jgi:hypothetical protein
MLWQQVLRQEVLRQEVLRQQVLRQEVLRQEVLRWEVLRQGQSPVRLRLRSTQSPTPAAAWQQTVS